MPAAELTTSTLTRTINEVKPVSNFLTRLLFPNRTTLDTETIEVGVWERERKMAPLVKKNSQSVAIKGPDRKLIDIEAPNIRIRVELDPAKVAFERVPGQPIFATRGRHRAGMRQHINRKTKVLRDDIDNRIEHLVAQGLTGVIAYSFEDEDSWEIDFQRAAGHTVALTGDDVWGGGATETVWEDFDDAKQAVHDGTQLPVTHAIFSKSAARAFINSDIKTDLDRKNISVGSLELNRQYEANGGLFMGEYNGVSLWQYERTMTDSDGSAVRMIRDKYVEFVSAIPQAENELFFGAIPEEQTVVDGGLFVGEIFSKAWQTKDPVGGKHLAHSRPLPVYHRPLSTYSLKVLA